MLRKLGSYLLVLLLTLTPAISTFAQGKKTAYGILLDNTRSLEKQFPQVQLLGKGVVRYIHPRAPVSLFNFASKRDQDSFVMQNSEDVHEGGNHDLAVAALGVEWEQDESILDQYIDSLSVVRGHTALFEAIHSVAETLNEKVNAEKDVFGDKVIILITDGEHRMQHLYGGTAGEDDERRKQQEQLIKKLKESEIKVYAVGLIRELNAYGGLGRIGTTKEKAELFLKKITKETGGRVIFPKSKKIDVDSLLIELLAQ